MRKGGYRAGHQVTLLNRNFSFERAAPPFSFVVRRRDLDYLVLLDDGVELGAPGRHRLEDLLRCLGGEAPIFRHIVLLVSPS